MFSPDGNFHNTILIRKIYIYIMDHKSLRSNINYYCYYVESCNQSIVESCNQSIRDLNLLLKDLLTCFFMLTI